MDEDPTTLAIKIKKEKIEILDVENININSRKGINQARKMMREKNPLNTRGMPKMDSLG